MPARLSVFTLLLTVLVAAGLMWPVVSPIASVDAAGGDFVLPWESGRKLFALQGQQQGSHVGASQQYAYDFSLAPFDGNPFTVVAARGGTVKELRQTSDSSPNCDVRFYSMANQVTLDHGDGTGTVYSHLLKASVLVLAGQKVAQGQPLARSDHSGYVCGTGHLHFTVIDLKTNLGLDRPFVDRDARRDGGRPRTSQWYTSDGGKASAAGVMTPRVFLPFLRK